MSRPLLAPRARKFTDDDTAIARIRTSQALRDRYGRGEFGDLMRTAFDAQLPQHCQEAMN